MSHIQDDEYEIPLRDQRYFGAGIKRKRVQFVPSTSTEAKTASLPAPSASTAASRYLDIVLKSKPVEQTPENSAARLVAGSLQHDVQRPAVLNANRETVAKPAVCDVCNRTIAIKEASNMHDSSITHQICLTHSHPPSHLDRQRKGLQVLSNYGWDPDSRTGLGAAGEGILHPIKPTENPQRAGLGLKPEDLARKVLKEKPVKLDAGKIRAKEAESKKKGQQLRDAFYRSEDVERYLGDDSAQSSGVDMQAFKQVKRYGMR